VIVGTNNRANISNPACNKRLAPGRLIILNNMANAITEKEKAPEINAVFLTWG